MKFVYCNYRQAKTSSMCINNAMKGCKNEHMTKLAQMITSQLMLTAKTTCVEPKQCRPELVLECLLTAHAAGDSMLTMDYNSYLLCGLVN